MNHYFNESENEEDKIYESDPEMIEEESDLEEIYWDITNYYYQTRGCQ
jgi:hypothetical protein